MGGSGRRHRVSEQRRERLSSAEVLKAYRLLGEAAVHLKGKNDGILGYFKGILGNHLDHGLKGYLGRGVALRCESLALVGVRAAKVFSTLLVSV